MALYFYSVDNKKNGPFTFEELAKKDIQRTTLIWRDGLNDWISAESLDDFKDYFKSTPPDLKVSEEKIIKSKIANEVITIEKIFGYSALVGIAVLIICFFVFNPFKFDGGKFENIEPIIPGGGMSVYYPAWMDNGFYDYTEGEIGFICTAPRKCYDERKSFLIIKALKYGFYSLLISFLGLLLYRYSTKTQKWVNENAT
jgi:GYF domain 2